MDPRRFLLATRVALLLSLAGCGKCGDEVVKNNGSGADAGTGDGSITSDSAQSDSSNNVQFPDGGGPSLSEPIDRAFLDALPKDGEGRPILMSGPSALGPGTTVRLVWQDAVDDPIARFAACLDLALSCQSGAEFDRPCVDAIPACTDDTGGLDCCAPACLTDFQQRVSSGWSGTNAITQLLRTDCQQGYREFVNEFGEMEAWQ